ncbi:hypothetical protein PC121_g16920 [Phytophthora cactorum]|nr:hypothetical protein PC120_g16193 [Phytophthora cactorum]KAG3053217.1 hypothetical protein PC121_g16920 [Phytophthora cactorum]KAG4045024.1 hypothetical protein PC123_g19564 [Phytophthora cactorum]
MVVESVASASTTTTQALPLCPLVECNHGSNFLVTKPIALLARFPLLRGFLFQVSLVSKTIALLPRFPLLRGFLFQLSLVPNTIALSPSFAFFLCLTRSALFLIGAIALTLRLLSSTDPLPLGVYTSSAVPLGGRQVGTSIASSLSVSCPSTFLLRSGHGCAPPPSLLSLALATLSLKVLRPSNSLLHHVVSRGIMSGLPDADRSCFSWQCDL